MSRIEKVPRSNPGLGTFQFVEKKFSTLNRTSEKIVFEVEISYVSNYYPLSNGVSLCKVPKLAGFRSDDTKK